MNQYKVSVILPLDGILLVSPRWSPQENVLYFVDKYGEQFYRFNPDNNNLTIADVGFGPGGMIVPIQDAPGLALIGDRTEVYILVWDATEADKKYRQFTFVHPGSPNNVISAGRVDGSGRLWFGSRGQLIGASAKPDQGTLYSMSNENVANPGIKIRPISEINGITFSIDNKKMFFNDSPTRKITAYDFLMDTGEIGNKTVLFDFDKLGIPGFPADMTIDADNNLWVPTYSGSRILKIDSDTGDLLDEIRLPVDQITSVEWGGRDLSTLYVTTGKRAVKSPKPLSGSLLAITNTGTKGLAPTAYFYPDAFSLID